MNPSYVALRRRLLLAGPTLDYFPANSDVLVPQVGSGVKITFSRLSTATCFNHAGQLVTVAQNVPRIDYDPVTGRRKGLLIEESRTNLLLWSEAFNNAAWVKNGVSVNPADDISVRGITLNKIVGNGNTFTFLWQEFGEVAAGQVVTFSAYMKQGGAARTAIRFFDNQTPTVHAVPQRIDWVDGVPSFFGGPSASQLTQLARTIEPVGDGVYRVTLTIRNDTGGPVTLRAAMYERWDTAPVAGEFTYWGAAQLEAGSFPTSYIKTEGSTVTRAADVCTISDISGFFNATEGSILAEFSVFGTPTTTARIFGIDDGTSNERLNLYVSDNLAVSAQTNVGGAPVAMLNTGTATLNQASKVAFAYKVNDFAACLNGGTVETDTSGAVPSGLDTARLGIWTGNVLHLNGHIRRILYWPKRLPNDQLQTLTA